MKTDTTHLTIEYDDASVRHFLIAGVIFALVGLGAGVLVATQLNFWQMNGKFLEWITFGAFKSEGVEYLTFGRLRPLHTNAAIFAFVGNMMFAGIYYSTQRLCRTRLASGLLTKIHFWGWQFIIVCAAISLPCGFTRGKEYAELIWPINIMVAVIWLVFAANFFWTLAKRNEKSLYVAIWFYIATIVTVTMLYVVNHLSLPTSLTHSYPIFGGVQDALVQWWYGHNAVAFFLTTPILGIMYYFVPKAANRPVYSYRLSVIHFWSLVFIYIWAGPHHLLNTALPGWLQSLGMLFSLMLWAPSWGGMLNGLLTLRGAWDKLLTDPVIKFFAAGVTFYGMATFEGPLMSIKSVNALSHYTDWTIGHVHGGTLGWNGFMAAGMFYWLAPRLWGTKLHSIPLANLHFWLGMVGILLYVASMWVSGITQGLMLNGTTEGGTLLQYPNFLDTLQSIRPMMLFRAIGGGLYFLGFILLAYNIFMTARSGTPVNGTVQITEEEHQHAAGRYSSFFNAPVLYAVTIIFFILLAIFFEGILFLAGVIGSVAFSIIALAHFEVSGAKWADWHEKFLEHGFAFTVLTIAAAAIGGAVQIIPTVSFQHAGNVEDRLQVPYTPLELAGRDIYITEGCYNCHSQMIRTMVPDVMRYGDYSRLGESIYDHPFQWGSKRTGPDLAREGGLRSDDWHYYHMLNPRDVSPGSNMPNYPWLFTKDTKIHQLPAKINAMRMLGVPYPIDLSEEDIQAQVDQQANEIVDRLAEKGAYVEPTKEIVALIAYLQKLGTYEDLQTKGVADAD
ncbi:cytochrome-c oxidase, cbb3-type subunit I [Coraliomargarita akajimensis]|uniref:cytochrome-c oxidase n=1 Tax=Coraliomargarita akajimensis (strain DSM 45221 / IAM 15411 / JCM 23193 / KCTC 12865 / 04OKA010-24) TaxID=583355 RepID=D5EJ83_CORAD|nr:cytochrome-c oxidase, cbb3-type subunit I [Coraliomargarita akajimensis]ADE54482.1 cytochrome c oxidase, cbb3-type, subunit I [Coraliomargarita akajimensis DSM 45221]